MNEGSVKSTLAFTHARADSRSLACEKVRRMHAVYQDLINKHNISFRDLQPLYIGGSLSEQQTGNNISLIAGSSDGDRKTGYHSGSRG
jgi:hypothetical protein